MLSRIWSASASTRTLQSFRFFSVSCYKTQANSTQHQNAPPKSFYQKLKEYPELRKMLIDAKGNTHKEFWAKLRAEPELLRAKQEEARRLNRRLIETNADARAKKIATATAYFHAHSQDEAFLRCRAISRWCFGLPDRSKSAWVREILPWKTHLPTRYHEEAYRFYSCCGTQRYLKTAWQSKTDPSEFLCQTHYAERGWDAAMPEGYEDVRTFKEICARYKQLNP